MDNITIEERRIAALIKQAEAKSKLHKKAYEYKADWLVRGTIGSAEWLISLPGEAELRNVDFCRLMPDGTLLTDCVNKRVLHTVQKWLFHCRMGSISGKAASPRRWAAYLHFILNLSAWTILYKAVYNPEDHGFMLLNDDAVKAIAEDLSQGSWAAALSLKERFIEHLTVVLKDSLTADELNLDPDNLPESFKKKAIDYFQSNDLYTPTVKDSKYEPGTLSRDYIGSILGRTTPSFSIPNFRLFLRQFEPLLQDDLLLRTGIQKHQHTTQNTRTIMDIGTSGMTKNYFRDMVTMIKMFFDGHDRLSTDIPNINVDIHELILTHTDQLKNGGHTKLIPIDIGLECLNQAAKWITVYGTAIISALEYYVPLFIDSDSKHPLWSQSVKKQKIFEDSVHLWNTNSTGDLPSQRLDQALNITKLQTRKRNKSHTGGSNFAMVVESFYGACAVVIGMLKPIRNMELCDLKRDCLLYDEALGGAYLKHEVGKTGHLGFNSTIERPIPYLAAHAIQLLQVLGKSLKNAYGDTSEYSNTLFYMTARGFKCPRRKRNDWKLNECINTFCDAINVPVDNMGRRWYVRIHEMRKFFLLLVHRHEGDNSKGLLRYTAGHSNARHLDDYIAYDISDSEAVRYESECIDDKLIALEQGLIAERTHDGLVALYTQALRHFKVTSISSIRNSELLSYLDKVSRQADFDIATYTLKMESYDGNVSAIEFAIRLGDKHDANYHK